MREPMTQHGTGHHGQMDGYDSRNDKSGTGFSGRQGDNISSNDYGTNDGGQGRNAGIDSDRGIGSQNASQDVTGDYGSSADEYGSAARASGNAGQNSQTGNQGHSHFRHHGHSHHSGGNPPMENEQGSGKTGGTFQKKDSDSIEDAVEREKIAQRELDAAMAK